LYYQRTISVIVPFSILLMQHKVFLIHDTFFCLFVRTEYFGFCFLSGCWSCVEQVPEKQLNEFDKLQIGHCLWHPFRHLFQISDFRFHISDFRFPTWGTGNPPFVRPCHRGAAMTKMPHVHRMHRKLANHSAFAFRQQQL